MPPYENQCNANGNMIAVYDTAKNYNRILYWDDDNRLTKTVDTQAGVSTATQYAYDAKGMRIIKDGPYGKSIYVDTGYVLSQEYVESNHVFVGNTRVASVVKHREETKPAMYYYASDHLGSSSVLTTSTGSYHERIEYLPYGEVWVEDAVNSNGYTTPYKFTGKELDKETGLYYFGARYYDVRVSRWISPDDRFDRMYKTMGLDVYCFVHGNPLLYMDPDGHGTMEFFQAMGNWMNTQGAKATNAISNSKPVKAMNRAGQYMNQHPDEALMIAGGVGAAATFIPIGMALCPEAIAAVAKVATKEAVKEGVKKAAVSGTIQAVANVSSNIVVNKDTSISGNAVAGLGGFGVGAASSPFGGAPGLFKSAVAFGIGAIGDMIVQNANTGTIDTSRTMFAGFMNMVGAHVTEPAIRGAQALGLKEGAAIQAGWTVPATWGTDALFFNR